MKPITVSEPLKRMKPVVEGLQNEEKETEEPTEIDVSIKCVKATLFRCYRRAWTSALQLHGGWRNSEVEPLDAQEGA